MPADPYSRSMAESDHLNADPKKAGVPVEGQLSGAVAGKGLPSVEQLAGEIAAAVFVELTAQGAVEPDIARQVDRAELLDWITEDVTAALADAAAGTLTENP